MTSFIKQCRSNFLNGDVFGTRLFYPWDFNLGILDFDGKCIYHDHQPLINTRLGQHFPWSEAIKKKSGSLLWINDMKSAKTWELFPDPEYKIRRITKFYFQEITKLQVIVVFESHLNLLLDMPTHNTNDSSKPTDN